MSSTSNILVELCRSNSIGSQFHEPTVIEYWKTSEAEARRLIAEQRPNGYFVRRADLASVEN